MFIIPDGTAIIQLLNFAIFFAVLSVLLRPVALAVRKRRAYIDSLASDYGSYQMEAAELRKQAESVRAGARREAEQIIAKARADASNRAAELSGDYAKRAQAVVEEAQHSAGIELERARTDQERLVRSLADEMLARALPEMHS
ncbi:MAG: ATP synthase F0 subunit B [Vulcanimicrobiaceae bacterium]